VLLLLLLELPEPSSLWGPASAASSRITSRQSLLMRRLLWQPPLLLDWCAVAAGLLSAPARPL
jgi:hypothetical protein